MNREEEEDAVPVFRSFFLLLLKSSVDDDKSHCVYEDWNENWVRNRLGSRNHQANPFLLRSFVFDKTSASPPPPHFVLLSLSLRQTRQSQQACVTTFSI